MVSTSLSRNRFFLINALPAGGPALSDLTLVPLSSSVSDDTPTSVWRTFSDNENKRLEAAWQNMDESVRDVAWRSKTTKQTKNEAGDISVNLSTSNSLVHEDLEQTSETEANPKDAERRDNAGLEANQDYIADPEQESQPNVVHVSQDNLFSADLLSEVGTIDIGVLS